jgi:hypothetical protein
MGLLLIVANALMHQGVDMPPSVVRNAFAAWDTILMEEIKHVIRARGYAMNVV